MYDLTLGSRKSHDIGEKAKNPQTIDKAGNDYDAYTKNNAPGFARVWNKGGITISNKEMVDLMEREKGEKLTPTTLMNAL